MCTNYNRKSKRFIQNRIFELTKGIRSNALILGGAPESIVDYVREINTNIAKGSNCRIKSFEMNFDTLEAQRIALSKLSYCISQKIKLFSGDISIAPAERYMDIDLMCALVNARPIIKKLFVRQKLIQTSLKRVFNFTVCMRSKGNQTQELYDYLSDLLGCSVTLQEKRQLIDSQNQKVGVEHYLHVSNSKYIVRAYSYRDGATMFTVCIKY